MAGASWFKLEQQQLVLVCQKWHEWGGEAAKERKKEKKKEKRGWNCSRLLGFDVSPTTSTVPVLVWPDVGRTRARNLQEQQHTAFLGSPFLSLTQAKMGCGASKVTVDGFTIAKDDPLFQSKHESLQRHHNIQMQAKALIS